MTNLIQHKIQPKTNFIIYYQGLLAIAATVVFFTRFDVYAQDIAPIIPLHWMIGFMILSFPLFISLLKRFDCISKTVLIWAGFYTALSSTIILIHPKFPPLQYLEDHYRTIIFIFLMLAIFAYHPLITKWVKGTILSVTMINIGMFVYEFFNPEAFYIEQRSSGRSSGFYDDSNTASIALIVGMIFTIDMIKPKYRIFYALFIFLGIAPTFSRGSTVGWILVVTLFMITKVIPRYQMSLLLVFFLIIISVLSTQLNNLAYLETADGTKLFKKDTLARVEFIIDPFGQQDTSQASRISFVQDTWRKFEQSPFIGHGLAAGEDASTIRLTGKAERSHNTYLDLMVEYGFLGAFVFPGVLLASVWQVEGKFRNQALAFVIFLLSQGFFSHTLLSEFCSLIFYSIMANLAQHSHRENSSHLQVDSLDRLYS